MGTSNFRLARTYRAVLLALAVVLATGVCYAQYAANRYVLILEDPPVSARFTSKDKVRSAAAQTYAQQIQARQKALRTELASRKIQVTGSASTLLNAVFVAASKDRLAELKALPGVKAVMPVRRYTRKLNRATQLMNAPAAWNALGGVQNAGNGVKIAILDSGIDQTHPAFQDPSLPMPAGYPLCTGSDCAFTNNKVIVARSYVRQLAAGSSPNPAADSRPDDYSPRDRDGHGTAVASCAAGIASSGTVSINGVAPKAYLGNYKIYGSPEVNDGTADDVIIQALEDAVNDGMDIISFSTGGPAFTGPLDSGSVCGNAAGVPCDLSAQAFENAAKAGVVIVASAGNSGQDGRFYPTFNSVESPADAPSVIAAGASTNSHGFAVTVSAAGQGMPSTVQGIAADPGDSFVPFGAVSAPLRDITTLGNDGLACSALPAHSLDGTIALIQRGTCNFSDKLGNAESAGASGVIFYMADSSSTISPGGLSSFAIPAVMIANAPGLALKDYAQTSPGGQVTIDPNGLEEDAQGYDQLAVFSSLGPATGTSAIKPDLVAPGTSIYMAAENYDPLGALYSSNRFAAADGTSFSAPITAGVAALIKQSHPNFQAADIRSALVNTAAPAVKTDQAGNVVDVQWIGAGRIDAGAAASATVSSVPATLSFGVLTSLPQSQQLQIKNNGTSAVTLSLGIVVGSTGSSASLKLDKQSLTLAPGESGTVTATLSGSMPAAGSYSGAVTVQAANVALRIPYLYLAGDGVPANIIPLTGSGFDGTVGQPIPDGIMSFKLVDDFGVPISGARVSWGALNGGSIVSADSTTDAYGIAAAQPILGSQPGTYSFVAAAGGLTLRFSGTARPQPSISANGIVDSASFAASRPVAPGSYVSIFGAGLSDTTDYDTSSVLPLAIDYVTVSFDVPSAGISVPGRPIYVSPTQINVQVPWELQGQSAAQVKVTIDQSNGNVVTVPLSDYAPAFFQAGGGQVAAQDASFQAITSSNPATHGQVVILYANGLGPVSNQPLTGEPASGDALAKTVQTPVVNIGGQNADIQFSGLTPGLPGLYQINAVVPTSLAPGNYPITVAIGGATSPASNIWVK